MNSKIEKELFEIKEKLTTILDIMIDLQEEREEEREEERILGPKEYRHLGAGAG